MRKTKNKAAGRTSDAGVILDRMTENDPVLRQLVKDARSNAEVAQVIFDARAKAKLTQKELAELVGTTQSVIARLEDADYEGHSLAMLTRIAAALHSHVEVRFIPDPNSTLVEALPRG
jgi:ribosome-binding protein aMBF1 (putative translation factor)